MKQEDVTIPQNKNNKQNVNQKIYTFMVKVVIKNSELCGYKWLNGKESNLDSYVKVKATTLKEAIDKTKEIYEDKNKYWIIADESYMLLDFGYMPM